MTAVAHEAFNNPAQIVELTERIRELEGVLAGWEIIGRQYDTEFSTQGLKDIARAARLFFLKNPMINRVVSVKADYVWGRSINISAVDPEINKVIQAFLDDPINKKEFTNQQARLEKDRELQLDGNLFFVLFPHPVTGKVRLSSIPFFEIEEIIFNPQNRKEAWYYKHTYTYDEWNLERGTVEQKQKTVYYRDYAYRPKGSEPTRIGDYEVRQDAVIYHVAVGGFSDWAFGISEVYSSLDWAKAYTDFLSNFASVVKALARYAWNLKTTGGARGVAAAKTKLGTTVPTTGVETNPPAVTAATFASGADDKLDPIRTAGATTPASEGRPIRLMIAAGNGIPETFLGDADVGNHATAKTLDRPTELGFSNRQMLWVEVLTNLINYALYYAVAAPQGPLNTIADIAINEYGETYLEFDEDIDTALVIEFPSVLEKDTEGYVRALISAFTLDGKQISPLFNDPKYVAKFILGAIGESDLDAALKSLFPEGEEGLTLEPQIVEEALKALTDALTRLQESTEAH